ncbi:glycosyltransferase family 2 protein [Leucobacter denitrificans]|uniref:Glycosyltransferase family 2 protein n=1 Tax=Leucobacter denitrificans TaxID=683042 RepID=A0A7G9S3J2_9MICO|nr:glycosyltransferase family 2 protein [Leucobacter denitrificans]QNN62417.1 glycosyltransferase family 2 protein [Leucobacter denitrificans]
MAGVAAVVVTFNRLEKLKKVIASIEAQEHAPSHLVIVDNASTDGTGEYLAQLTSPLPHEVVSLETNTGGAGGFSAGMRRGYELGADFVWIMDDDGYPEPDALAKLDAGLTEASAALGAQVPFACSMVTFTDGEICEMNNPVPTWDWGRLLVKGQRNVLVSQCSFVSVLIPRWVIAMHGLPYKEYFIWFDDAEYTIRISRETPGIQVLDSVTVHDMGENKGVNWGMVDEKNAWKFAYGARNQASFHWHHRSKPHFLVFAAQVLVGMRRGKVSRKLQRGIRKKLWEGVRFNPQIDRVA